MLVGVRLDVVALRDRRRRVTKVDRRGVGSDAARDHGRTRAPVPAQTDGGALEISQREELPERSTDVVRAEWSAVPVGEERALRVGAVQALQASPPRPQRTPGPGSF